MTEDYRTALLQQIATAQEELNLRHSYRRYDAEMFRLVNLLTEATKALLLAQPVPNWSEKL